MAQRGSPGPRSTAHRAPATHGTPHACPLSSPPVACLTRTRSLQAEGVKAEPFESHSALEIAEQLTLLDHLVFRKIPYE